jgi:hypothetical protein
MNQQDIQNLIAMYYRALKGGLIEHHELPALFTAVENAKRVLSEMQPSATTTPPAGDLPPAGDQPNTTKEKANGNP